MTDEGMQEADSDPKEICKGGVYQECFCHCPRSSSQRKRIKQIEMSNYHLGSGSLPSSFCLPLILVKKPCGMVTTKVSFL